jgi:3-methylfumaryl-CoA hydratase
MLELPRRHAPDRRVHSLAFRFHSPVFAGERLVAAGTDSALRIATYRDDRHATAEVTYA